MEYGRPYHKDILTLVWSSLIVSLLSAFLWNIVKFAAGWEVAMATMYLLLMLSTKLLTIMTLVITKTGAQEHYSALNTTTWLQILSERKTWAILNFPEQNPCLQNGRSLQSTLSNFIANFDYSLPSSCVLWNFTVCPNNNRIQRFKHNCWVFSGQQHCWRYSYWSLVSTASLQQDICGTEFEKVGMK